MKQTQIIYTVDYKMGQTYVHLDYANTLAARDYKQPQTVVIVKEEDENLHKQSSGLPCKMD